MAPILFQIRRFIGLEMTTRRLITSAGKPRNVNHQDPLPVKATASRTAIEGTNNRLRKAKTFAEMIMFLNTGTDSDVDSVLLGHARTAYPR
jgi:hypothetical protein